jgi:deoxyribose-phosphate aldolase
MSPSQPTTVNIAASIDHSLLNPDITLQDIKRICAEAIQFGFYGVCIPPFYVREASKELEDSNVKVITVVGFPMGYSATPAKVEEIKRAIDEGADEIDFVANIAAVKNNNWNFVKNDIDSLTRACHLKGKVAKVIIEITLLTEPEIIKLCTICNDVGINYVKTSSGFQGSITDTRLIALLKEHLDPAVKIKVSGGIVTYNQAAEFLAAGASRLGVSRSIQVIQQQ